MKRRIRPLLLATGLTTATPFAAQAGPIDFTVWDLWRMPGHLVFQSESAFVLNASCPGAFLGGATGAAAAFLPATAIGFLELAMGQNELSETVLTGGALLGAASGGALTATPAWVMERAAAGVGAAARHLVTGPRPAQDPDSPAAFPRSAGTESGGDSKP